MPWNPSTEQAAIGETANDALVTDATAPTPPDPKWNYTRKVDALMAHAVELGFTESDFADLCTAAADQAGASSMTQSRITELLKDIP